jgi:DNA invertase Pin-like site-specific DNA recombinase
MKTALRTAQTAVLYARVSSKDQEREGFSIPAQKKLLREYAHEHGLTIVREFVDVETAKQAGRSGFSEMLVFLKATPACQTILVEKTDRLYRNIKDWTTVDDLGVTIHFVKENTVVSPHSRSSEKFMHGIKVLMAKNYVDNLSEEVKKGQREKAAQGHWPSVAPVGYVNNRETHRIEVDPGRGPLITSLFDTYASGEYSLKALTAKAHAIGLTHPRSGRRMMKAEIHRILQNPIYVGDFRWLGTLYRGSHEPLVTRERFAEVQAVLTRKPRARYPKQRHAFMGLLTCALCGCTITAERKKGKYTYYRCTGFHGPCGNTYVREERLADLLGAVVEQIQIPGEIADWIAEGVRESQSHLEIARQQSLAQLRERRRAVQAKLDRGYDDYLEGRISEGFWTRKSKEWESELTTVDAEVNRFCDSRPSYAIKAERILELAKQAGFLYQTQNPPEQRRLLDTVLSNCTFDRGTLCPTYTKPFDLFVRGNETGEWRGRRDSNPFHRVFANR